MNNVRKYTNKLLELIAEGMYDKDQVINAALNAQSESEVALMCRNNDMFLFQAECEGCEDTFNYEGEVNENGLCQECQETLDRSEYDYESDECVEERFQVRYLPNDSDNYKIEKGFTSRAEANAWIKGENLRDRADEVDIESESISEATDAPTKCGSCKGSGEDDGEVCQMCGGSGKELDESDECVEEDPIDPIDDWNYVGSHHHY